MKIARLIIFRNLDSHVEQSFVTLMIRDTETGEESILGGTLPKNRDLSDALQRFHEIQSGWTRKHRGWRAINTPDDALTNQASNSLESLISTFNEWLESQSFTPIKNELSKHINDIDRLIIDTQDISLQRLPWKRWNILENHELEISMRSNHQLARVTLRKPVKILLVLGNDEDINLEIDKNQIENLIGASPKTLHQPTRQELYSALQDQSWDILFFAGHSFTSSEGTEATLHINKTEYVTFRELSPSLKKAAEKGLKIAIFNSCSGLGIAQGITKSRINIPYLIVMIEPIHDQLAHKFLEILMGEFTIKRRSLQKAFKTARHELSGWLYQSPNADYLPVIFHHPEEPPLYYPKLTVLDYIQLQFRQVKLTVLDYIRPKFKKVLNKFRKNSRRYSRLIFMLLLFVGSLIFWIIYNLITPALATCPTSSQLVSCGEKNNFINYPQQNPPLSLEYDARNKFDAKKYPEAIKLFQQVWQEEKDPANLIGLNNATIMQEIKEHQVDNKNVFFVGAVIPFNNAPEFISRSMLTGIAWQQDKINTDNRKQKKPWRIVVLMANDNHDKDNVSKIAKEFGKMPNILGVVGSYSSHVTYYVINEYSKYKLSLIAPTVTFSLENLPSFKPPLPIPNTSYFFRPVGTSKLGAKKLVQYLEKEGYKKVIIFRNDQKLFGGSFYLDFRKQAPNLEIIDDFYFAEAQTSEINNKIKQWSKFSKDADKIAFVLLPDAFTETQERQNKLEAIKINKGEFLIAGNNTVADPEVLALGNNNKISKEALEKMVVSVPWFPSDDQVKNFQSVWGTDEAVDLMWYTAFSHDALQMLAEALTRQVEQNKQPTREETRNILASSDFETEGLTGRIILKGSDRQPSPELSSLIKPDCSSGSCQWVKIPESSNF